MQSILLGYSKEYISEDILDLLQELDVKDFSLALIVQIVGTKSTY